MKKYTMRFIRSNIEGRKYRERRMTVMCNNAVRYYMLAGTATTRAEKDCYLSLAEMYICRYRWYLNISKIWN